MMYIKSVNWNVLYYEEIDGQSPILDFVQKLKPNHRLKILNWIEQLKTHGPQLPRPYADIIEDGIHELRVKLSGDQIRVLYFFSHKDYIILTHSFIKRESRVPKGEIKKAQRIREDFLARFPTIKKLKEAINEEF